MIYNDKLSIAEYIETVNEIVSNYFNDETGEYYPQFGNLYTVYLFFMNCVESEEGDVVTKESVSTVDEDGNKNINFTELQKLFDDPVFMEKYNEAINKNCNFALDFCSARWDALKIIDSKLSNANAFAIAISSALKTVLEEFRESFSDESIKTMADLAQQIKEGKLSEQAIVEAYEKSDRFAVKTKEVEEESKIIRLPERRVEE